MTGHLEWSVKLSLLLYVTSAPGGRLETEGVTSSAGLFQFPLESVGDQGYSFGGTVAFYAHHGSFITALSDLRLQRGDDGWTLATTPPGASEAVIAWTLREGDDGAFEDVTLTAAGAELFGGYYAAGDVFDPLRVVRG